jgi:phage protein D
VTLGGATLSSETLGPLIALDVQRAKNSGADRAAVRLGRVPQADPAQGDPVAIEMGWEGETTLVFTGHVQSVERSVPGLAVECAGSQAALIAARSDRTFLAQSAGEVVSVLASDAGVEVEAAEDGIRLSRYLADSMRHSYDHCLGLALRCGFDLYTTESGSLVFAPFTADSADHEFRFGAEIVSTWVDRTPVGEGVAIVPESPASASGDDTASWLVKDPSPHRGEAGGTATLIRSDPIVRTKEAADTAAGGWLDRMRRDATSGGLELMGSPQVGLGDAVALAELPDRAMNATYQVMAVRHLLDRQRGFRTAVALAGLPEGSP